MHTRFSAQKLFALTLICLLTGASLQVGVQARRYAARRAPDDPRGLVWQLQAVEAPKSFVGMQPRSLALDAAGRAHISYRDMYTGYLMVAALLDEPPTPTPTRTTTPTRTETPTPGAGRHMYLSLILR